MQRTAPQAGRVASEPDLDTAMRLGVNYPLGPLAWARRWGTGTVLRILDNLEDWYRDGRYRASPLLRRVIRLTPSAATPARRPAASTASGAGQDFSGLKLTK